MKKGQYITFYLDVWEGNSHFVKEFKAIIIALCHDPLRRHESKCIVIVENERYGIPLSEIKVVYPADGEQLKLFNS